MRKPESADFVSVALDIAGNMQTIDEKFAPSAAANIGSAAAAGSALTVARSDHVHTVGSGTVSAPGLPIGESNSGFYRIGAANIGATIAGALAWAYSVTGIAIETALALKHVASVAAATGYVKIFAKSDENLYKHTGANDEVRILDADIFTAQGDIVYGTAAETFTQRSLGTQGYALMAGASAPIYEPIARRNKIINGDMRVKQRTTPGSTDDTYTLDRWNLLLEAASAAAVTQETSDVPTNGSNRALKLTVGASNNNKFGIATYLEFLDVADLRGKTVSLQAKLKASNAQIGDVRMAVLEWTSTADTLTSDVVTTWGAAGTNPTLATNWAYLGTPANLSVTTSWATYKAEGLTVGASANNLAVFIWCDDKTTTAADTLLITDVQLEEGSICTSVERRPYAQELAMCHRYLQAFAATQFAIVSFGVVSTDTNAEFGPVTRTPMRAAPSMTDVGTNWAIYVGQITSFVASSISMSYADAHGIWLRAVSSGMTAQIGRGCFLTANTGSGGQLLLSAEL